jgi:hypothetical protein
VTPHFSALWAKVPLKWPKTGILKDLAKTLKALFLKVFYSPLGSIKCYSKVTKGGLKRLYFHPAAPVLFCKKSVFASKRLIFLVTKFTFSTGTRVEPVFTGYVGTH